MLMPEMFRAAQQQPRAPDIVQKFLRGEDVERHADAGDAELVQAVEVDTLFWAAEALAAWAALAAFGVRMNAAALMAGFGTGMVYTRRTGPLGGAGILLLMLPPALWSSGAPLAVLPTLRTMSENKIAQDASTA
jgi:hypothetical protein